MQWRHKARNTLSGIDWKNPETWALVLIALALALFIPNTLILKCKDSYQPLHPLICAYFPGSKYNTLFLPCSGEFDLTLFGHAVWTRAFFYVGAMDAVFYFPFYLLLPNFYSFEVYTLSLLALMVFSFARLTGIPLRIAAIGFATHFYLVFQIIRNIGPPGYQCASIFLVPLLVRQVIRA